MARGCKKCAKKEPSQPTPGSSCVQYRYKPPTVLPTTATGRILLPVTPCPFWGWVQRSLGAGIQASHAAQGRGARPLPPPSSPVPGEHLLRAPGLGPRASFSGLPSEVADGGQRAKARQEHCKKKPSWSHGEPSSQPKISFSQREGHKPLTMHQDPPALTPCPHHAELFPAHSAPHCPQLGRPHLFLQFGHAVFPKNGWFGGKEHTDFTGWLRRAGSER